MIVPLDRGKLNVKFYTILPFSFQSRCRLLWLDYNMLKFIFLISWLQAELPPQLPGNSHIFISGRTGQQILKRFPFFLLQSSTLFVLFNKFGFLQHSFYTKIQAQSVIRVIVVLLKQFFYQSNLFNTTDQVPITTRSSSREGSTHSTWQEHQMMKRFSQINWGSTPSRQLCSATQ